MIIFLVVTAFLIFSYHWLRNGMPWKAYGSTVARLIWAASFVIGYAALAAPHIDVFAVGLFFVTQFLAMLVPHAFAQNMGTWPTPQKEWPAFFLPTKTAAQWTAMSSFARTRYDFYGMLGVGIFRSLIVFGVSGLALILFNGFTFWTPVAGIIAALSQPFAYLIGKYIPFSIWDTTARSAEWGEVLVGLGWAVSLAAYVGFSAFI